VYGTPGIASETAQGGAAYTINSLLLEWQDEDDRTLAPSSGADDPYDKFTVRARRCITYAEEEARGFQHNYIGTEHLLLALLREEKGIAAHALVQLGARLPAARMAVEFIIGRGDSPVTDSINLTPRAKKVIQLAVGEAQRMNHDYIGTEHLLLGLVREGDGIAVGVLESLGVQPERIFRLILRIPGNATPPNVSGISTARPSSYSYAPSFSRDRFDRFTERARRVLSLSQEEAQRFQHNYIGTEHLLLGLVREGGGVAARVLGNLGIELDKVRSAVEQIIGRGDRIVLGEIGLTPRSKKVIELAVDEARRMNHHYIGTEHLLLGLVREGEGIAAGVLASLGVNLEKVRIETIRVLSMSGASHVSWQADTDNNVLTDQEVSGSQDEDDFTPAPAREEGEESNVPGVFTVRARRVLDTALEEAHRLQVSYVGTEHLLLGLVSEEKGLASLLLQQLKVDRETIRMTVEFVIEHSGSRAIPDVIGFTPRSRKVIRHAVDEAFKLDKTFIGTEHLLLAMLLEGEGIAAGVLISLGVTIEKVYIPLARRWR
jgi:ATP-dependent Clp protease ATP-binding subunit ClpA